LAPVRSGRRGLWDIRRRHHRRIAPPRRFALLAPASLCDRAGALGQRAAWRCRVGAAVEGGISIIGCSFVGGRSGSVQYGLISSDMRICNVSIMLIAALCTSEIAEGADPPSVGDAWRQLRRQEASGTTTRPATDNGFAPPAATPLPAPARLSDPIAFVNGR